MVLVLLYCACGLGLGLLTILFGRFYLDIQAESSQSNHSGNALGWFIHPVFLQFRYTYPAAYGVLRIAFWTWKLPFKDSQDPLPPQEARPHKPKPSPKSQKSTVAAARITHEISPRSPLQSTQQTIETPHSTYEKTSYKTSTQQTPRPKRAHRIARFFSFLRSIPTRLRANPWVYLISQRAYLAKIGRWLIRILKAAYYFVSIKELSVRIAASFENPADTAKLYGYCEALRAAVTTQKKRAFSCVFVPCFANEPVSIFATVKVQTSVWQMLGPVFIGVATFPYLHTFWILRAMKKRTKHSTKDLRV